MNSNWSYSPETAKWGYDLCDLDLWPWPFAWTSHLSWVTDSENFMMIRWWEHNQKGVTDRQTDGLNQSLSCLVAAKNLDHSNKRVDWHGIKRMWVDRMLDSSCDFKPWPHPWPWPWIFKVKFLIAYFRNGKVDRLGIKEIWVGYNVGCTMGLLLGHSALQIDRPSNGSMWNSDCFQSVSP